MAERKVAGWRIDHTESCDIVDAMPVDDLIAHEWGKGCVCGPGISTRFKDGVLGVMFMHYSLDNREAAEV